MAPPTLEELLSLASVPGGAQRQSTSPTLDELWGLLSPARSADSWRDAAMPADQLPDDGRGIAGDTWAGITGADWSIDPARVGGSMMAGMAGVYDAAASGAEYAANVAETIYPYTPMAAGERLGGALGGGVRSDAEREAQVDNTFASLRAPARRAMDYWAPPEQAAGLRERPLQAILETTAQSAPTTAALAAATAASGGAALPLAFAVEAGGAHDEARGRGVDRETALAKGAAVGAVNSILERTGLDKILGKGPVDAGTLQRAAAAAVTEGGTEMAQELVGIAGEVATGAQMTGEQVAERLLLSSAAGGLAGGGLSAIHSNRDRQVPVPQPGALGVADSSAQLPLPGGGDLRALYNREFTARGDLPEYAFEAKEKAAREIAADKMEVGFIARDLESARNDYLRANPDMDFDALNRQLEGYVEGKGEAPPELAPFLDPVRERIDGRTQELIDSGAVPPSSIEVLEGNAGKYLGRFFAKHEDKRHLERVRGTKAWEDARSLLVKESPEKSADEIEGMLEVIARHEPDAFGSGEGSLLGSTDVNIFKGRKDIADPILELMGVYHDPVVRFVKTMERTSRTLARHKMYQAIYESGLGKEFFPTARAGFSAPVPGESTHGPLGGVYTSDRMLKALDAGLKEGNAGWVGLINGVIKANTTVGSVQGQMRNGFSNLLALLGSGNPHAMLSLAKGFRGGRAGIWGRGSTAAREFALDGARYGVTGGNVDIGDLKFFLKRFREGRHGKERPGGITGLALALGEFAVAKGPIFEFAAGAYELGDTMFKLAAWDTEIRKLRWALPDAPAEQVKERAAENVRRMMQNYDRLPKAVQRVNKSPLVGPFVSFSAAVTQGVMNTTETALQEIQEGGRMRSIGLSRLGFLGAALMTPAWISGAMRSMSGMDEEEELAVKELGPKYLADGQVGLISRGDGKVRALDLSFIDYYGPVRAPVLSAVRAGQVDQNAFAAAAAEIAAPFSEEMGTAIVTDLYRNQGSYGQQIRNPDESLGAQGLDVLGHAVYRAMPGTARSLVRINKARTGHVEDNGRSYDLQTEALALGGPRMFEVDLGEAVGSKARGFKYEKGRVSQTLKKTLQRRGEVSGREMRQATSEAYLAMRRVYGRASRSYQAGLRLGLDRRAALNRVLGARVSGKDVGALDVGRPPEEMAREWLLGELGKVNGFRAREGMRRFATWKNERPQATPQEIQKARVKIAEEWAPIRLEEILQELAEAGRL